MRKRVHGQLRNMTAPLIQAGIWAIAVALVWGGTVALSSWAANHALASQRRPGLSHEIGTSERDLLAHAHIERVTYMDGPEGSYLKISTAPEQGYMAQVPQIAGIQHLILAPRDGWAVFLKVDKPLGTSKAIRDTHRFIRMTDELVRQSGG